MGGNKAAQCTAASFDDMTVYRRLDGSANAEEVDKEWDERVPKEFVTRTCVRHICYFYA